LEIFHDRSLGGNQEKTFFGFSGAFALAVLLAPSLWGSLGRVHSRLYTFLVAYIDNLVAKTQPHFDEVRRNIPAVVEKLPENIETGRLCGDEVRAPRNS